MPQMQGSLKKNAFKHEILILFAFIINNLKPYVIESSAFHEQEKRILDSKVILPLKECWDQSAPNLITQKPVLQC